MCVERVEPWSESLLRNLTEDKEEPDEGGMLQNQEIQPENAETQNPDTGSQTEADQAENTDETATLQDIHEIEDMMGNLMYVLKDQNATIDALRKRFPTKTSMTPKHIIPFSSDRKYSGAVFEDRGTYLMGAAQFLFPEGREEILDVCQKYAQEGLRVLTLAHSSQMAKVQNFRPILNRWHFFF